jgi:hypothetical protein
MSVAKQSSDSAAQPSAPSKFAARQGKAPVIPAFAMFPSLPKVDRTDLLGSWHIQRTTFPMWLTGRKLRPSLQYGALNGDTRLTDLVTYATKSGQLKQIHGYDSQNAEESAHFTWRGKGLLAPLRSDWLIYYLNAPAGIAAIYFTKTLFTPEGLDILSREERPPDEALQLALTATGAIPGLARLSQQLRPVFK